jgi:uncharacterized cupredoxin-like copper-binding protein
MRAIPIVLTALALLAPFHASAHGEEKHSGAKKKALSAEQHPWGREGDPAKASRTILVDMSDAMRFTPSKLTVKRGETVKFVVANSGKTMHEMVIGTEEELRAHAELMKKHPGMEHDAPYMAHVSPGKKETIAWTFDKPGTFMYGCLIPGHWEAGMKGTIVVAK